MSRFAVLLALTGIHAFAAETTVVRSGPFEVYSLSGERPAQDMLNFAEQLRYALGWQLGNPDLQTLWPVRVMVAKNKQSVQPACRQARDAFVCSVSEPVPEFASAITRILLGSWVGHLPPAIERGLIQVYSTIDIAGTKVVLGAVPPNPDRDWSRAHMLSVDPGYSGKLRVMLGNLSRGVEPDVAYRNAFGLGPDQIEAAVNSYLEARNFGTITAPSRPLNARKQFLPKPASPAEIAVLQADLAGTPAAYQALMKASPDSPEAHEGLGLLAVEAGQTAEARKHLALAKGARGLLESAKLQTAPEQKRDLLTKAASANPKWAEPYRLLAALETHPAQKLVALRKATQLEARNPDIWVELAQLQEENKQFPEAGKSWAAAERATGDPEARERVRQSRLAGDRKRIEADIAAQEEARRQTRAEMEALRNKALMGIREAEARANAGKPVMDGSKLDVYKEGSDTKKITGILQRVDCLGQQARLVIGTGKRSTSILVQDPAHVSMSGGQNSFTCGPQKPPLNVVVEYLPRTGASQASAGDAVSVEFR